jgi:hypothetical protein
MSSRTCSGCSNDLPKADFSKNQWQKGPSAKCKGCVSGNPPPPKQEPENENPVPEPSSSPELREQPEEAVVKREEEEQAAAAAAAEKGRLAMTNLKFYWGYK